MIDNLSVEKNSDYIFDKDNEQQYQESHKKEDYEQSI